jgi:putative ABC transport system permease protein
MTTGAAIALGARELRARPARNALTLLAITLGVALMVALSLVSGGLMHQFRASIDALAGRASLEVWAGDAGFPEDVLETVRADPDVRDAMPVVVGTVFLDDGSGAAFDLLGIDLVNDTRVRDYRASDADDAIVDDPLALLNSRTSLLVARPFLVRHGLAVGDEIPVATAVGRRRLTVRGALEPHGAAALVRDGLAVMDVYAAQRVFDKVGRFDRISIVCADGVDPDTVAARLRRRLDGRLVVDRPARRGATVAGLLDAFQHTLLALSLCALLVGLWMAYAAASTAVVLRAPELAMLRQIGARRAQVAWLLSIEAAVLGGIGAALGVAVGRVLASLVAAPIAASAETQFVVALGHDPAMRLGWREMAMALAAVAATALAVVPPARAAGSAIVVRPGSPPADGAATVRAGPWGLLLVVGAATLVWIAVRAHSPALLTAATVLSLVGGILLALAGGTALARMGARPATRGLGLAAWLVGAALARQPRRVAAGIAVLAVGLTLEVAIGTIYTSMKTSLVRSVAADAGADLLVSSGFLVGRFGSPVSATLPDSLAALAGVQSVTALRAAYDRHHDERVLLRAYDDGFYTEPRYASLVVLRDGPTDALARVAAGGSVLVSQNFASRFGVAPGGTLELAAPAGRAAFAIAGVVLDLEDNVGSVWLRRDDYRRWWLDSLVNVAYVTVRPGIDVATIAGVIERELGTTYRLRILRGGELLEFVRANVDRAFAFAGPLVAVVLAIVALGLSDTLLVSLTARTREIATLRAVGATHGTVRRLLTLESLAIAAVGTAFGIIGGTLLALVWTRVHFRELFGLVVTVEFPRGMLLEAATTMLAVALVAAAYPLRRVRRLPLARTLAQE